MINATHLINVHACTSFAETLAVKIGAGGGDYMCPQIGNFISSFEYF
jgi:hypothetical protein